MLQGELLLRNFSFSRVLFLYPPPPAPRLPEEAVLPGIELFPVKHPSGDSPGTSEEPFIKPSTPPLFLSLFLSLLLLDQAGLERIEIWD